MTKSTFARVLRAVADALEAQPASPDSPATPKRRLLVQDAPPEAEPPQPYEEPDLGVEQILARVYLAQALRRFSPHPRYHA